MLVEGVKDYAIYMLAPEGRVTTWNTGAERIMGYAAAEIIGKPFATFFTPEDKQRGLPEQLFKEGEKEGRLLNEGWRVRKDGSRFWSQGVLTALHDENGKLLGFSEIMRDVALQKDAEGKIHQLNE